MPRVVSFGLIVHALCPDVPWLVLLGFFVRDRGMGRNCVQRNNPQEKAHSSFTWTYDHLLQAKPNGEWRDGWRAGEACRNTQKASPFLKLCTFFIHICIYLSMCIISVCICILYLIYIYEYISIDGGGEITSVVGYTLLLYKIRGNFPAPDVILLFVSAHPAHLMPTFSSPCAFWNQMAAVNPLV